MLKKTITENPHKLTPYGIVSTRTAFNNTLDNDIIRQVRKKQASLPTYSASDIFEIEGYCLPCRREVAFLVDMKFGRRQVEGRWIPNWRERLQCPYCKMNNRQRLIAGLIQQEMAGFSRKTMYFMEQVTPIFRWATASFPQHCLLGSEYLGYEYDSGVVSKGIRHEDVENLSFADAELDFIVSNDVFEHVPNPERAFNECCRVLNNAGVLLATFPFHRNKDVSTRRAAVINGTLEHMLPPLYHGNPISPSGSLVFTDFGWDVLDLIKSAGFMEVNIELYASSELGHLGEGQLIFRARKRKMSNGQNDLVY